VKGRDVYLAVSIDDRVPTFKVKREIGPELDSLDRVRSTILFKSGKDMLAVTAKTPVPASRKNAVPLRTRLRPSISRMTHKKGAQTDVANSSSARPNPPAMILRASASSMSRPPSLMAPFAIRQAAP
jgi:hypothetical protein